MRFIRAFARLTLDDLLSAVDASWTSALRMPIPKGVRREVSAAVERALRGGSLSHPVLGGTRTPVLVVH